MSQPVKVQAIDPLSFLTRLSPTVYLYDPINIAVSNGSPTVHQKTKATKETIAASSSAAPKIIVLFAWMSARPIHILKYLSRYQNLYPTSRILIVRSSPADLSWRSADAQRRRLDPAVSTILCHCNSADRSNSEILLHLFSNGGCSQLLPLLDSYRQQMPHSFPPHIKILDSCPGRGTFKEGMESLSVSFPQSEPLHSILYGVLYLMMGIYFITFNLLGITDPIEHIRQALNDMESSKNERARCYIYGDADKMVRWSDVEAHAEDAREKGLVVRTERFGGSGHVAHARQGGGGRYWSLVEEVWRGSQGKHQEAGVS